MTLNSSRALGPGHARNPLAQAAADPPAALPRPANASPGSLPGQASGEVACPSAGAGPYPSHPAQLKFYFWAARPLMQPGVQMEAAEAKGEVSFPASNSEEGRG